MRYHELLNLLETTSATDWVTVSPPRVERVRTSDDDLQVWTDGHDTVAFLRSELDVSVAWGAPQHEGPWEGIWGAWSNFPDRAVSGVWADLRWRGQPVHRQVLALADGGRFYLPAPTPIIKEDDSVQEWVVDREDLPLARLVDSLSHPRNDLKVTLNRVGIAVRS